MKPRNYKDDGVVLSRKNFGEADRIITIYTKNNGKITFVAKGIRNIKSRKKGHLEVFSNISFSSVFGNGMDILTEAQTKNNFINIRSDLKKTAVAYFLLEVIYKITHDTEKNQQLYEILVNSLDKLDRGGNTKLIKDEFIEAVLVLLGFWPFNVKLTNPDQVLTDTLERRINSSRVGKKLIS